MQTVPRFRGIFTSVIRDRLTLEQRAHKSELPFHGQPRTTKDARTYVITPRQEQRLRGLLFWTGQKDLWPIYLGLIQSKAQTPCLETLLVTHPFPTRGVHGASETVSNEPQRLFARSRNKLSCSYTSHDLVVAKARCAITTALQPSTSINRGLIAVPKVESNSSSKPSLSNLYLLERGSACRYTPPIRSKKALCRILPPLKPPHSKHRQSPSNQVRSQVIVTSKMNLSLRAPHSL